MALALPPADAMGFRHRVGRFSFAARLKSGDRRTPSVTKVSRIGHRRLRNVLALDSSGCTGGQDVWQISHVGSVGAQFGSGFAVSPGWMRLKAKIGDARQ